MVAKLLESACHLAEHKRRVWRVELDHGTTLTDIVQPLFWSHNGRRFTRGDEITVLAADNSFYAHLIVTEAKNTHAKVEVLIYHPLGTRALPEGITEIAPAEKPSNAKPRKVGQTGAVAEHGGAHGWRVRAPGDKGEILAKNLDSFDAAVAFLEGWERDLASPAITKAPAA